MADQHRVLDSVFGRVRPLRLAYRHRGAPNLYVADARWALLAGQLSLGLVGMAATGLAATLMPTWPPTSLSALGCACPTGNSTTSQPNMAADLACYVDDFYAQLLCATQNQPVDQRAARSAGGEQDRPSDRPSERPPVLMIQADGKGVSMIRSDRPAPGADAAITYQ